MQKFVASHLIVAWDIPTDNTVAKRQARRFCKQLTASGASSLLGNHKVTVTRRGSCLIQTLVANKSAEILEKLQALLPADGEMRVYCLTEAQLTLTKVFWGRPRKLNIEVPAGTQ